MRAHAPPLTVLLTALLTALMPCASATPAQRQVRVEAVPTSVQSPPEAPPLPPLTPRPQAPYRMRDHCPLEYGCVFGVWQACEPLVVRSAASENAPIRHRLATGERFHALRADMVTTRFGRVRVEYPMSSYDRGWPALPIGTEVIVRNYYVEGGFGVWAAGRAWDVEGFWSSQPSPRLPGRLLDPIHLTWWVEVKTLGGVRGWLALHNDPVDWAQIAFFAETVRMRDDPVTEDAPGCRELLHWRD